MCKMRSWLQSVKSAMGIRCRAYIDAILLEVICQNASSTHPFVRLYHDMLRFPEMGVAPDHPCLRKQDVPLKTKPTIHPFFQGASMTMETSYIHPHSWNSLQMYPIKNHFKSH